MKFMMICTEKGTEKCFMLPVTSENQNDAMETIIAHLECDMHVDTRDYEIECLSEETARSLLAQHGYENITEEANKQNKQDNYAVFAHPSGQGVYYCETDKELLELVIDEGLVEEGHAK